MKTLRNLLRKEKKPLIERVFSADEIKPFFQANGIDIETIGFPNMKDRNLDPINAYWINFENIKVTPIKIDDVIKIVITGKYRTRARTSYQDSGGGWHPGTPSRYSFRIEEDNLSLKEK